MIRFQTYFVIFKAHCINSNHFLRTDIFSVIKPGSLKINPSQWSLLYHIANIANMCASIKWKIAINVLTMGMPHSHCQSWASALSATEISHILVSKTKTKNLCSQWGHSDMWKSFIQWSESIYQISYSKNQFKKHWWCEERRNINIETKLNRKYSTKSFDCSIELHSGTVKCHEQITMK